MIRDELLVLHHRLAEEARALIERKSHDYASSTKDALATLRSCGVFGVPPTTGVVVRLLDKLGRLQSLAGRDPQVAGESVKDTVVDIINYAVLWYALYLDDRQPLQHPQPAEPAAPPVPETVAESAYVEAYLDWCVGRFGSAPHLKPDARERIISQLHGAVKAALAAPTVEAGFDAFVQYLAAQQQNWGARDELAALYRLLASRSLVPDLPAPFRRT